MLYCSFFNFYVHSVKEKIIDGEAANDAECLQNSCSETDASAAMKRPSHSCLEGIFQSVFLNEEDHYFTAGVNSSLTFP